LVLIAGKGHEDYQEIQGVRYHFDDAAIVKHFFREIKMKLSVIADKLKAALWRRFRRTTVFDRYTYFTAGDVFYCLEWGEF
jgi:hypothetical protein